MAQYGQEQYDYDQREGRGRGPSLTIDVSASNRARGQQRGIDPRDRQAQQQHDYELAQQEAHMIMEGHESPDSGEEVAEALRIRNGEEDLMMDDEEGQLHSQQYHQHHHDDGMEHDEHDDIDDSGSFSDSLSSSPSIPDEDIDFTLVYALHTFLATVDGQASVVKGDKLLLLDDSNSYWWLVRVLKTQAVGYIPAENIETPWERLARLNKHRNVDVSGSRTPPLVLKRAGADHARRSTHSSRRRPSKMSLLALSPPSLRLASRLASPHLVSPIRISRSTPRRRE